MIPENLIYFSLNLTSKSIEKLKRMLFKNQIIQAIIKTNWDIFSEPIEVECILIKNLIK